MTAKSDHYCYLGALAVPVALTAGIPATAAIRCGTKDDENPKREEDDSGAQTAQG